MQDRQRKIGISAKAYKCNVANEEEVKKTVEDILKDYGKIDILVNNAAVIVWNRLHIHSSIWQRTGVFTQQEAV